MKLNLIPQPKKAELLGHVFLRPGAVTADAFFESAAETFMDFRARLFGAVSDGVPVTADDVNDTRAFLDELMERT